MRGRERRETVSMYVLCTRYLHGAFVCVCVKERARERERESETVPMYVYEI